MKESKEKDLPNVTYIYNLALKREDGMIEQDTVYRGKLFTEKEIEELGVRFSCSVLVELIGTVKYSKKDFAVAHSFVYNLPKPKVPEEEGVLENGGK